MNRPDLVPNPAARWVDYDDYVTTDKAAESLERADQARSADRATRIRALAWLATDDHQPQWVIAAAASQLQVEASELVWEMTESLRRDETPRWTWARIADLLWQKAADGTFEQGITPQAAQQRFRRRKSR